MNKQEKQEIFINRIIDMKEALITAKECIKMANNNLEIVDKAITSTIKHFENIDDFIDLLENFDDYKEFLDFKTLIDA